MKLEHIFTAFAPTLCPAFDQGKSRATGASGQGEAVYFS